MPMQVPERQKLKDILLIEPLSPETELKKRNLLFTACFSILLSVYGLKVTKSPWLDFEIPDGAPNILHGALSVALLYTFVVFLLYTLSDLYRWFAASDLVNLNSYFDISLKIQNHLNSIENWLEKPLPNEDRKKISVQNIFNNSNEFLNEINEAIEIAKNSHRKLSALQYFRLILIDLGLPLSLGIFAMFKIGPAFFPFLRIVFQ